jgi:hypothetical protein
MYGFYGFHRFVGMFHSVRKVGYKWGYEQMYGFHGFHRFVRIFWEFLLETQAKKQKKSVPIGEIREIRTSIRIPMDSKVEPKNETSRFVRIFFGIPARNPSKK